VEEFAWRRQAKGQRDNYCRPCRADYKHEHYANNRARYVEQAGRRRQSMLLQRTIQLVAFFRSHPCADCGETEPVVLEFDHRGDKTVEITRGIRERSWSAVLTEIDKCDVVCANCHRRRTAFRGGFARAVVAQR